MRIEFARDEVPDAMSWAEYADERGDGTAPVLAVDLSGDPLRFASDPGTLMAIRRMGEADLRDLQRWVNQPHVARWWDEHRTVDQVAAHYGPALRGEDPTRLWVWEVNGRSVGYAQDYRIADHPEYALLCGHREAVGFDYAIGEPAYVGRGLGTRLLWAFLRDIVTPAYPEARELFAAPDHRNRASLRVLAKVGAEEGLWFDEPTSDGRTATVVGCSIDVARVMATTPVTGE